MPESNEDPVELAAAFEQFLTNDEARTDSWHAGALNCRVCGVEQSEPPWGDDGKSPTHEICNNCGVQFGYQDGTVQSVSNYRQRWRDSESAPAATPQSTEVDRPPPTVDIDDHEIRITNHSVEINVEDHPTTKRIRITHNSRVTLRGATNALELEVLTSHVDASALVVANLRLEAEQSKVIATSAHTISGYAAYGTELVVAPDADADDVLTANAGRVIRAGELAT